MIMKITLASPSLVQGESKSRTLHLEVDPVEYSGKTLRLAFITPLGKFYITDPLTPTENGFVYTIPNSILDRYGKLRAQIIITGDDGYCKKSNVFYFEVTMGLEGEGNDISGGTIVNLAMLHDKLLSAENCLSEHTERLSLLREGVKSNEERLELAESEIEILRGKQQEASGDIESALTAISSLAESTESNAASIYQIQNAFADINTRLGALETEKHTFVPLTEEELNAIFI